MVVEILRLNFQEPLFLKKCGVVLFGPLPFLPQAEKKVFMFVILTTLEKQMVGKNVQNQN